MCLKIGDRTRCSAFKEDPTYDGKSPKYQGDRLEFIQHRIEEGEIECTGELMAIFADIFELTLDEYLDELTVVRSERLKKQLNMASPYKRLGANVYFSIPKACRSYVRGNSHTLPMIPFIDKEAQQLLVDTMIAERVRRKGVRIEVDLTHRVVRHGQAAILQMQLISPESIKEIAALWARNFFVTVHPKNMEPLRSVLEPNDATALDRHLKIEASINVSKTWNRKIYNTDGREHTGRFFAWKQLMRRKYLSTLQVHLEELIHKESETERSLLM